MVRSRFRYVELRVCTGADCCRPHLADSSRGQTVSDELCSAYRQSHSRFVSLRAHGPHGSVNCLHAALRVPVRNK